MFLARSLALYCLLDLKKFKAVARWKILKSLLHAIDNNMHCCHRWQKEHRSA